MSIPMRHLFYSRAALASALLLLTCAHVSAEDLPSLGARTAAYAQRWNSTPVAAHVLQRVGNRPVIKVRENAQETRRLTQKFADTLGVVFVPHASEWGHALIRVGSMVYHLGDVRYASAKHLSDAFYVREKMAAYEFMFKSDRHTVQRLKRIFADKVQKIQSGELHYQLRPWETNPPQGQNCETFVTSTLKQELPHLGLYEGYKGAVGLAQWCMRPGSPAEAACIYAAPGHDPAARDNFRFDLLD